MPSGRTHDSITLWSLPLIAGITFERTHNSSLALLVSGGFLFSGLMFGPDLDIYSRQYKRWGLIRWIWLPYRKAMRHRSLLSHGPIVGTVVRVVYLLVWLSAFGLLAILLAAIAYQAVGVTSNWQSQAQQMMHTISDVMGRSLQQYPIEWLAVGIGLELGALSHGLSDWLSSAWKRMGKRRRKQPMRQSAADASPISEFDPLTRASAPDLWNPVAQASLPGEVEFLAEDDSELWELLTDDREDSPFGLLHQAPFAAVQHRPSDSYLDREPHLPDFTQGSLYEFDGVADIPDIDYIESGPEAADPFTAPEQPSPTPPLHPPRRPESWKGPELPPFIGK